MEKGFYHPERGYWQATNEPSQDTLDSYPDGTVEVPIKPSADHDWNGSEWVYTPPDPAEVAAANRAAIPPLSKAQLQIGLVQEGWITEAEGRAWITQNTLPPAMSAVIDTLPAGEQIVALARAHSMTQAERTDPLVADLGKAEGKSPEEIDTFWLTYAQV